MMADFFTVTLLEVVVLFVPVLLVPVVVLVVVETVGWLTSYFEKEVVLDAPLKSTVVL